MENPTTQRFWTDAELIAQLEFDMSEIIRYEGLIRDKVYLPENASMDDSKIKQNTTSTIYSTIINTLEGKATLSEEKDICLTPYGLFKSTYKGHNVNRLSMFKTTDLLSEKRCVRIDVSKFPACQWQLTNPDATVSIFAGGTKVVAGCRNEDRMNLAMRVLCDMISSIEYPMTGTRKYIVAQRFAITQNGVVSKHVGHGIDNGQFYQAYPEMCHYQPITFVAVVCRIEEIIVKQTGLKIRPVTALIFDTGNLIFSGVSNLADVDTIMDFTTNLVYPFRTETTLTSAKSRQRLRVATQYTRSKKPRIEE